MKAGMLRMLVGKELQCEVRFPGKLAKEGLIGVGKQLYSIYFGFFLCGDPWDSCYSESHQHILSGHFWFTSVCIGFSL